ncbi:MAG: hypothetical protein NZ700_16625 [Gemmataceae bacterium]|nr:hypothetical protein [Gemmataceae bacterium]MDW8266045.1 hypothetical protein [Gemmataceae bacterium]
MRSLWHPFVLAAALAAPAYALGQAPCPSAYYFRSPVFPSNVMPSPSPRLFTGARYGFYVPPTPSVAYQAPTYSAPMFYNPRYPNPGPYFYTRYQSLTPGYYSYYYTPGFFRY